MYRRLTNEELLLEAQMCDREYLTEQLWEEIERRGLENRWWALYFAQEAEEELKHCAD